MAVAGSNPGKEDLTSAASSFTFPASGSWTPVNGELVLVAVGNRKGAGTADTPTVTGTNGWNVTWTQVDTQLHGGNTLNRQTLFRGVASSGTAGTFTVDFAGVNQAQCGVVVVSFSGVDQATSQGIVQSAKNSGSLNGALAATLAAFGDAGNATYLCGNARGTPSGFTPEGSFTGYSVTGGVQGIAAEWLASNDTSPTGTLTSGSNWAAIAVEIKASTGGATGWGPLLGPGRSSLVVLQR